MFHVQMRIEQSLRACQALSALEKSSIRTTRDMRQEPFGSPVRLHETCLNTHMALIRPYKQTVGHVQIQLNFFLRVLKDIFFEIKT